MARSDVPAGVPQGGKLGPWLFLLMIKDLSITPPFTLWKYIDDTILSETIKKGASSSLQSAVNTIHEWASTNRFEIHPTKTKELRFDFTKDSHNHDPIQVDDRLIEKVQSAKLLGLIISSDLKWNAHIEYVVSKASKRLYFLIQLKRARIQEKELCSFYIACIRSVVEYACEVYHFNLPQYLSDFLERIQKRALSIILPQTKYEEALALLEMETLKSRRTTKCIKLIEDITSNNSHKLACLLPPKHEINYNLRKRCNPYICKFKTNRAKDNFINASLSHMYK